MLIEKKIQNFIDALSIDLQFEADVLDLDAKIIASTSKAKVGLTYISIPVSLDGTQNRVAMHEGRCYTSVLLENKLKYYLSFEGSGKAAKDSTMLVAKLIEAHLLLTSKKLTREDCLRKILSGDIAGFNIEEASAEHKIELSVQRCVFVIRTPISQGEKTYNLISEAFSKNRMDYLVRMDNRTLALIKAVTDDMENGDFPQLAAAIFETVFSETSVKISIGVGKCKTDISQLRDSYIEAQKAIEVGLMFNSANFVHIYDNLLLERFISEIPEEISSTYLKNVFTDEFSKMFTPEMAATVENLFNNSLNLSEASRRLYVHRNTLVYRIEKIKKMTNLDLRNFHDAVTFRIMMMFKMHH